MATSFTPKAAHGSLNGTTVVTVVTPAATETIVTRSINFYNIDSVSKSVRLYVRRNAGTYVLVKASTIGAGNFTLTDLLVVAEGAESDDFGAVMTTPMTTTNPVYWLSYAVYEA